MKFNYLLIGQEYPEIEKLISERWHSFSSIDEISEKTKTLPALEGIIYNFIIHLIQGKWFKAGEILYHIETYLPKLSKYQLISYTRMKAMIKIASGEIPEAVSLLEKCYEELPHQNSWLRRTIAVDLRNILFSYSIQENIKKIYHEKTKKWEKIVKKHWDQNPLTDRNESRAYGLLLKEYLEATTINEGTHRMSNNLREALSNQYKNLILSAKIGYYTGVFVSKQNIGLILYQWANINDYKHLYQSSLIELIENTNKNELEKILEKFSDKVIDNRSDARYFLSKVESLDNGFNFDKIRFTIFRFLYNYLDNDDCEKIDKKIADVLDSTTSNLQHLELKKLALKIIPAQSLRIPPNWFINFALQKIQKKDEHIPFYRELFKALSSVNISKCEKSKISALIFRLIDEHFVNKNGNIEKNDIFNVIYNSFNYEKIKITEINKKIINSYSSQEEAFTNNLNYFSVIPYDDNSDVYKNYINESIPKLLEDSKSKEEPKSFAVGGSNYIDHINNILIYNYEKIDSQLWLDLAEAVFKYCLCPFIEASSKRTALHLLLKLSQKFANSNLWISYNEIIRKRFEDFASAISLFLFQGREKIILGAIAGNVYLSMGGMLTPPLWNHIINDKKKSYLHRMDCINCLIEIINYKNEYATTAFYIFSDLINDSNVQVSTFALEAINYVNEYPENILSMICQSVLDASKSENPLLRKSALKSMDGLINKINNKYWIQTLEDRYKEMKSDDNRLVRVEFFN